MNRYIALDAMRGLTIAAMILVNMPGDWSYVYAPLLHSHWHGLTATDLVFPFFLFIIGSAMFFAFKKVNYQVNHTVLKAVFKRSIIIFLLGLFLNAFPFYNEPIESLRIMGVLQRIAICYLIASVIVLTLKQHWLNTFIALLLLGYWAILAIGGYQIENNLVQQIDLAILGQNHMYALHGYHFEPEGLLSSLPGVASMLIGFQVTKLLTQCVDPKQGIKKLTSIGIILLILGTLWSLVLPINKSLWTSSYVLISSAFACFILAIFVLLADVLKQQKIIFPFLVYGLNPLFIYVVSWLWEECYRLIDITLASGEVVTLGKYFYIQLSQWLSPVNASLAYAIAHVSLFWLISLVLYQKKIIIKI